MKSESAVEVPYKDLGPETLQAVIEAFILQEGTNYGDRDVSLETMIKQVHSQLERGEAKLFYDPITDSCALISPANLAKSAPTHSPEEMDHGG